jgi:tetratricopeptide (TPR) repeat protein
MTTTMICPMLSALKPVDQQGRPVNRECIYEGCRFFNAQQRDCNLMIGSRAMIQAAEAQSARPDLGKDLVRFSQDVQKEVGQAAQATIQKIAALEAAVARIGGGLTQISAQSSAQISAQIATVVETQQKVADRLLEEISLLTATVTRTEQTSAGLAARIDRVEAALGALQEGHRTVMDSLEARLQRDRADLEQRRQEEAVGCNNRGVALYYRNALDAALDAFRKALQIKPDYAEACSNMGLVLSKLGREKQAVESFQKALTLDPKMSEIYNNLGFLYHTTARYDRAVQMFGQAIENAADSSVAYTNLGNSFYALKQSDKAVEAWRRAVELDPLNENARRGLRMFQQDARN